MPLKLFGALKWVTLINFFKKTGTILIRYGLAVLRCKRVREKQQYLRNMLLDDAFRKSNHLKWFTANVENINHISFQFSPGCVCRKLSPLVESRKCAAFC